MADHMTTGKWITKPLIHLKCEFQDAIVLLEAMQAYSQSVSQKFKEVGAREEEKIVWVSEQKSVSQLQESI